MRADHVSGGRVVHHRRCSVGVEQREALTVGVERTGPDRGRILVMTERFADGVVSIEAATRAQLSLFEAMEKGTDTSPYVLGYTLERHQEEFDRPDVRYKSVYDDRNRLVGFIILVLDPDGRSVEFARIVIADKGRSYGSRALALAERVCEEELDRGRIWLDVFEFNDRARHVYENSGYRFFGTKDHEGKTLRLYEKEIRREGRI